MGYSNVGRKQNTHAQRTNMYKYILDIFFEKLKDLEPIVAVEIGVVLKCTLQTYGNNAEESTDNVQCRLSLTTVILINPLKTKRRLPYLKTQFVPRSKDFSSRL